MGCGVSRFESEGPAPIDPPDTPKQFRGDHKVGGNVNHKEGDVGVAKTASNGRRSVSSLVKGRRFFKRVAHSSIVERKKEEEETGSVTNVDGESDDDVREDSILMGPGSPSFRVYCDYPPHSQKLYGATLRISLADAGDEEITKPNASLSDSLKGSMTAQTTTRKRKARGGIRNALRRGGSAGVKMLLPASTRSSSHEQAVHAIARPTGSING